MAIRTIRIDKYLIADIDFDRRVVNLFITDDSQNTLHFNDIKEIYERIEKGDVPLDDDV